MHNETWYEAIASKDQVLDRCERSLREGIDVVGRDTAAGARIAETLAFFEFIQTELPRDAGAVARAEGRALVLQYEAADPSGALEEETAWQPRNERN